jgi:hypothetical protein
LVQFPLSLLVNVLCLVLPRFQGDCKVNGLDKDRHKMETEMSSFFPVFS